MWPLIIFCMMTVIINAGCSPRQSGAVQTIHPHRGEIREYFTESASTRLQRTYHISMPVSGRIGRIDLEPGDAVVQGQVLVEIDRYPLENAVAEAVHAVRVHEEQIRLNRDHSVESSILRESREIAAAARELVKSSATQIEIEKARSTWADNELQRLESLADTAIVARDRLDDSRLTADTSSLELKRRQLDHSALETMTAAVELIPGTIEQYMARKNLEKAILEEQLAQAQARLENAKYRLHLASITSPTDGVILERHELGDRQITEGQLLLTVGNPRDLEVVADILTQDAVNIDVGSKVEMRATPRSAPIPGVVKRIEPAGFTKLSSLGIEQQRVNVVIDFIGDYHELGIHYDLDTRFYTGIDANALIVPRTSVRQDVDGDYYVFSIANGRYQRRVVQLGLRGDFEIEIVAGLSESDEIVEFPDHEIRDGVKVGFR